MLGSLLGVVLTGVLPAPDMKLQPSGWLLLPGTKPAKL
jgi:hypothetical protein